MSVSTTTGVLVLGSGRDRAITGDQHYRCKAADRQLLA
jgi:hypothetical protein